MDGCARFVVAAVSAICLQTSLQDQDRHLRLHMEQHGRSHRDRLDTRSLMIPDHTTSPMTMVSVLSLSGRPPTLVLNPTV